MIKKLHIILFLFLLCICIMAYLIVNYKSEKRVGTITINTKELESGNSVITFKGNEGEQMEVTFDSNVRQGEWHLHLTDSDRRVLHTFETDKSINEKYRLPESSDFRLEAAYEGFVGKVRVKAILKKT